MGHGGIQLLGRSWDGTSEVESQYRICPTERVLSVSPIWSTARIGTTGSALYFHAEISRELVHELPVGVGKPTEVPKSLTWELLNRLQHPGKYEAVELLADNVVWDVENVRQFLGVDEIGR